MLFINTQKAVKERQILQKVGYRQPPTPMQTDESTAEGISSSIVSQNAQRPWNEIPLTTRPLSEPEAIQIILAAWNIEFCQLLGKTPSRCT